MTNKVESFKDAQESYMELVKELSGIISEDVIKQTQSRLKLKSHMKEEDAVVGDGEEEISGLGKRKEREFLSMSNEDVIFAIKKSLGEKR